MLPRASDRASKGLAPIRRKCALSFENAISIGLGSGLYGGSNKNRHPCLFRAWAGSAMTFVYLVCIWPGPRCFRYSSVKARAKLYGELVAGCKPFSDISAIRFEVADGEIDQPGCSLVGREGAPCPMLHDKPHRRRGTDTKELSRKTGRMPRDTYAHIRSRRCTE